MHATDKAAAGGHDFSPEGTMVMPSSLGVDSDADADAAAISTFVGGDGQSLPLGDEPAAPPVANQELSVPEVDFDFDLAMPGMQTVVNPLDGVTAAFSGGAAAENMDFADTVVGGPVGMDADALEFDVKLTDSVFLGQQPLPTEFDIGSINLDLSAEPAQTPAVAAEASRGAEPAAAMPAPESVHESAVPAEKPVSSAAPASAPIVRDEAWEQVNTKLDLAKAYEEMGDIEGARELLQEVAGEGAEDLVAQAHAILERIGG